MSVCQPQKLTVHTAELLRGEDLTVCRATRPTVRMEWHTSGLLLALTVMTVNTEVPLIKAPWGALQGISVEGDGGRRMNAYLGIPYALPPVGELRFEKPQPHPGPENGATFAADKVRPACPQIPLMVGSSRETSEDCLILDVFVPTDGDRDGPLAVMIFIHGGAFYVGDAYSYRPSKLVVDGRVIVVPIQYRLGALGFLSTGDATLPGNVGLWDQNLAIRWVKDNIQAFRGDPSRITIFGESAGSMSVGLQMLSPQSRGLFQRGIMQSGAPGGLSFLSETLDMKAIFRGLAAMFECPGESTAELVTCLKGQTEEDYFNKSTQYSATSPIQSYFFPVVDGEFIPRDANELIQDKQYMKQNGIDNIDLIIGLNSKEGGMVVFLPVLFNMSTDSMYTSAIFDKLMDTCILLKRLNKNSVIKKIIEFYYRGAEFGANVSETLDAVVNMYGDCLLSVDILDWAKRLAASSHSARHYVYVFDHEFVFNKDGPVPGSHHADELMLEFDNSLEEPDEIVFKLLNKSKIALEEQPLSDKFVQILTSFAKTGNPNPPLKDDLGGGDWPQFTNEDEAYLSLSMAPHVVRKMGPFKDRYALWTSFLPELTDLTSKLPTEEPAEDAEQKDTARDEL